MLRSDNEAVLRQIRNWKSSILPCLVSAISVFSTQFSLSLLPRFLPSSSFITLLPLSALLLVIVIGLGRFCKRAIGVRASAPAFVLISILFIWAVFIFVVRQEISSLLDIVFNLEIIMVIVGLYCIILSDPGYVTSCSSIHDLSVQSPINEVESQEEEMKILTSVGPHHESPVEEVFTRHMRVRYCRHCKNYVTGFDHHCPAFGSCIGQRNHAFFLVLLIALAISEASYVVSAYQFTAKSKTSKAVGGEVIRNLVLGTTLFCLIQVLWQVVFIMWHVYCACFNIKTDEWINWRKYPEFQNTAIPRSGEPENGVQFINPYDKGIIRNLKEFFSVKR